MAAGSHDGSDLRLDESVCTRRGDGTAAARTEGKPDRPNEAGGEDCSRRIRRLPRPCSLDSVATVRSSSSRARPRGADGGPWHQMTSTPLRTSSSARAGSRSSRPSPNARSIRRFCPSPSRALGASPPQDSPCARGTFGSDSGQDAESRDLRRLLGLGPEGRAKQTDGPGEEPASRDHVA